MEDNRKNDLLKKALFTIQTLKKQISDSNEPVAVIGMACRFPGGCNSPEEYWAFLQKGEDSIIDIPKDRWDIDEYYDPVHGTPGKMYVRQGSFLQRDVSEFDAKFFKISPAEANSMDPQQRQLLEVCWEALENAGENPAELKGSKTGVFIGISSNCEYAMLSQDIEKMNQYFATGTSSSIASGRIAYTLGLNGPALSVDTACSSSLVTTLLAVDSLKKKECDVALAGGVNLMLSPNVISSLCAMNTLSESGKCTPFDESGDGYGRGEGCGIIVLKRLADAKRDGDRIYATICGGAMNNDGESSGLTVPNGKAQKAVIEAALKNSGLKPEDISYLETHGTGTALGDPIEVKAITEVFGSKNNAARKKPLALGAVKGNLGHLEIAAGIASVIKVVLSLHHKQIVPIANCEVLNSRIDLNKIPAFIPKKLENWEPEQGRKRVAGISGFGFSGTNVHIILAEEAGEERVKNKRDEINSTQILALSAKEEQSLVKMISKYETFLSNNDIDISDVCYTANACRPEFMHRAVFIGNSREEFSSEFKSILDTEEGNSIYDTQAELIKNKKENTEGEFQRSLFTESRNGKVFMAKADLRTQPKLVFVFSGNTQQIVGSLGKLRSNFPKFEENFDKCLKLFETMLEKETIEDLRLLKLSTNEIHKQILLFTAQYAVMCLLEDLNIKPEVVFGEMAGSYIAAVNARIMDIEAAVKLFSQKLQLMEAAGEVKSIRVYAEQVLIEELLEKADDKVSISAVCSGNESILTGAPHAIDSILALFMSNGIRFEPEDERGLPCKIYSGSQCEFSKNVSKYSYSKPKCRYVIETKGEALQGGSAEELWNDSLVKPIQFGDSMDYLYKEGYRYFLEIGESICNPKLYESAQKGDVVRISLINDTAFEDTLYKGLAKLYCLGIDIQWRNFYKKEYYKKTVLPNYPFMNTKYWLKSPDERIEEIDQDYYMGRFGNPLKAKEIILPYKQRQFKFIFSHRNFRELIDNSGVVHMGYYLEMLAGTIHELYEEALYSISNMEFLSPIMVMEQDVKEVLLSYETIDNSKTYFSFHSKNKEQKKWILNVKGIINILEQEAAARDVFIPSQSSKNNHTASKEEFYSCLEGRGFYFGKSVKWVDSAELYDQGVKASFRLPKADDGKIDYSLAFHPGIMDSCAQTCNFLAPEKVTGSKKYMISRLDGIIMRKIEHTQNLQAFVRLNTYDEQKDELGCTIYLTDENNKVIVSINDVYLKVFDESKLLEITNMQSINSASKNGLDKDFIMKYSAKPKEVKLEFLVDYVKRIIADELEIPIEKFDIHESLDVLGIDSMSGLRFYNKVVQLLGVEIPYADMIQAGSCEGICRDFQRLLPGGSMFKADKKEEEATDEENLEVEHWIYGYKKKPQAKIRIFCFPYGFGSADMYKEWQDMLGDEVDVCPIKLPGLDLERMKEKTPTDIDKLMDTIDKVISNSLLDLPCVSFGHSWGSLFAYRLAYKLSKNPKADFIRLFVSGYTSASLPNTSLMQILSELKLLGFDHIPDNEEIKQTSSSEQISKAFVSAWGIESGLEEVIQGTKLTLPLIVSAYRLIEKYQYDPNEKFDTPIIAFHGIDDYRVSLDDINAWQDVTSGSYKLYTMVGDHGFILKDQSEGRLIELLKKELSVCTNEMQESE